MKTSFLLFAVCLSLTACSTKPLTPLQAPPAVEVLIPVPVPCKVAEVAPSRLPSAVAAPVTDIWDGVKIILADRATLKADRTRMAAANSNPCPAVSK